MCKHTQVLHLAFLNGAVFLEMNLAMYKKLKMILFDYAYITAWGRQSNEIIKNINTITWREKMYLCFYFKIKNGNSLTGLS